jgi:Ran-binding protein 1
MANILQSQDKNFEAIDDSHKETVPTVDTSPQFKTLEEDEDVLLKVRAKMYRFDKTGKEWRERGKGDLKVLKHKQTEKIRVLMRRDKTYKICANHYISPITKLQDAPWNDKTLIYTAMADFTDGEAKDEVLAVQFTTTQCTSSLRSCFHENYATFIIILLVFSLIRLILFICLSFFTYQVSFLCNCLRLGKNSQRTV